MTDGHRHRIIKVNDPLLIAFLTKPRYWTRDEAKVMASPYPYGPDFEATQGGYYLSILSVLHRWTGLTLKVNE